MIFGNTPNLPGWADDEPPTTPSDHIQSLLQSFTTLWELGRVNREKVAKEMTSKISWMKSMKVGDLVKIFAFSNKAQENQSPKWLAKWSGPYQLQKLFGVNATISDGTRTQVVHISRILPYQQRERQEIKLGDLIEESADLPPGIFEVDRVIAHRWRNQSLEFLVKWSGFSDGENTWEPARHIAPESIREYEERSNVRVTQSRD